MQLYVNRSTGVNICEPNLCFFGGCVCSKVKEIDHIYQLNISYWNIRSFLCQNRCAISGILPD